MAESFDIIGSMMKYIKFMPFNSVVDASRNRREMAAAAEYGFDVYCYSADRVPPDNTAGMPFSVLCDETPPLRVDASIPHPIRVFRVLRNMLQHARKLRGLDMDVISCHNIRALATAYLAYWFIPRRRRPELIYDSHELELARKKRSRGKAVLLKFAEGFLMRRCSFTIVVNDGIADELQKIHRVTQRPVVVRSTPGYWRIDEDTSYTVHSEYCAKLGIPEDSFIISYHGNIQQYRGLEEILTALEVDKSLYAVWIGNAQTEDQRYEYSLLQRARDTGVDNRLLRYPAKPHDKLWKYVASASASIIMMNGKLNANYQLALPNKFFEAIQSETPVICSDTVEMARIVRKYDIGLLVPSGDGEKLAEAIAEMRDNADMYARFKKNLIWAKNDLCWENEKNALMKAYDIYLKEK